MSVPRLRLYVGVCSGCLHWQVDVRPQAIREFGSNDAAARALVEAHAEHVRGDCPGGDTGRIKVNDQWVERPVMESGKPADGILVMEPLPRWWDWV